MTPITITLTPEQIDTLNPMTVDGYRRGRCIFGEVLRNVDGTTARFQSFDRKTWLRLRKVIESAEIEQRTEP